VALFLDATLVRMVILPSVLTLLGDRSWYLPAWLGWLPHLEIEAPGDPSDARERETAGRPSTPSTRRSRGRRGLPWPVTLGGLGGLAISVVIAVVATSQPSGAALPQTPSSPSPVYRGYFADPSVLVADGRYYAYATESGDENIQMISSKNFWDWSHPKDVLPTLPVWAEGGFTWAPAVAPSPNGGYQMFFAARDRALGIECVGRATARTPAGPFVDPSRWPFICQVSLGGSIDPYVFRDSGTDYLIWKSDGANGAAQGIWAQAFSQGDAALAGSPVPLISATTSWEAGVVEGPAIVRLGGTLHLYFSANRWSSYFYSIGTVTCASPLGPCRGSQPHDWLTSATGMIGPGGPTFFVTPSGRTMMAFAAWTRDPQFPGSRRALFVSPVTVDGAGPTNVSAIRSEG
jgi:GH43 family beta-xylosidase